MAQQIDFYGAYSNSPFRVFSNFANYPIIIDDEKWFTNEHYFQAQKFVFDREQYKRIKNTRRPVDAKRLGSRRGGGKLRSDWESVKDEVMLKALRAKFTQHSTLRTVLISTGNAKISEHTEYDSYWGDGGFKRNGLDKLGKLLMQVRSEIQSQ